LELGLLLFLLRELGAQTHHFGGGNLKTVLVVLSMALLAGIASAAPVVTFDTYSPVDVCQASISSGGLDFSGGYCMGVWTGNPNGNGTPALIYDNFGGGQSVTMSLTGGGAFTLNSVDMSISWYDSNPTETILVNGITPIVLVQGSMTYTLNLTGTSFTFPEVPSAAGYWLMDNINYSTTPEPGTLALLGSGVLAGVSVLRRKLML
jgi:hypothetical protein